MSDCSAFRRGSEIGGAAEHAAVCASCADWLAGQRRAVSALARLADDLDDSVLPGEHEAALRRAFREARQPPAASHARHWSWALAAASVGAAAIAIVVLLRPAVREQAAPEVARTRPTARLPVAEVRAAGTPGSEGPTRRARVQRLEPRDLRGATTGPLPAQQPTPSTAAAGAPAELASVPALALPAPVAAEPAGDGPAVAEAPVLAGAATLRASADDRGFSPLPGAETTNMDSGQIVRVQLRSDVADAAFPLPRAGTHGGPIEAEVLVGPEGVARGIRVARPRR